MLFSILIPVYNVDKYLSQCLDSVLSQTENDFEVILVNDGSTDNSDAICKEYSLKDQRIRYFSKANEGLLLTRRYSLRYVKGDYVLFLDSDDYWQPNILSVLKNEIERDRTLDMILFRFNRISDSGKFLFEDRGVLPDRALFTTQNKNEFLKEFVSSSRLNNIWSKCVKRKIVDVENDYSRFRDVKGEDLLQSMNLIRNSNKILYLDKPLLNYRLSPTGRGRNFKLKYIRDLEIVRYYVYEKLQEMEANDEVFRNFYNRYVDVLFYFFKQAIGKCTSFDEYKHLSQEVEHFKVYTIINKNNNIDISNNPSLRKINRIFNSRTPLIYYTYYKLLSDILSLARMIKKITRK